MNEDLNLPRISRKIGRYEYRGTIMPLTEWYPLQDLVMEAFGEPLEKLCKNLPFGKIQIENGAPVLNMSELLDDDFLGALAEVVHGILRGLQASRLERLVDSLEGNMEIRSSGKWMPLEQPNGWFRRNMRDLIPVLILHLEVQFKDFFVGALSPLGGMLAVQKKSNSNEDLDPQE